MMLAEGEIGGASLRRLFKDRQYFRCSVCNEG